MERGFAKLSRGPEAFAAILHAIAVPAPHFMAWLTILTEFIGGLAVLLGAFIPLVSLPIAGIQVPRGNGFHAFRHANATLMSSFGASQKLRQQRLGHADGSPVTETIYTHVISEDGKRIAAQLGKAVWGVFDPNWTLKENGSGVESPKPLYLN